MFPKFDAIAVGQVFESNNTAYVKTDAFTFVELLNAGMGEQTITPFIEERIKEYKAVEAPSQDFVAMEIPKADKELD